MSELKYRVACVVKEKSFNTWKLFWTWWPCRGELIVSEDGLVFTNKKLSLNLKKANTRKVDFFRESILYPMSYIIVLFFINLIFSPPASWDLTSITILTVITLLIGIPFVIFMHFYMSGWTLIEFEENGQTRVAGFTFLKDVFRYSTPNQKSKCEEIKKLLG